jgi:hypothetical protein
VARVPDGELEDIERHVDVVHLEHLVALVLDALALDVHADTLARNDDVGETVVRLERPTRLAAEGKGNIADVGLDLGQTQAEAVVVGVEAAIVIVSGRYTVH